MVAPLLLGHRRLVVDDRQRRRTVAIVASTKQRGRGRSRRTGTKPCSPRTQWRSQFDRKGLDGDGNDDERRRQWLKGILDSRRLRPPGDERLGEEDHGVEAALPARFGSPGRR